MSLIAANFSVRVMTVIMRCAVIKVGLGRLTSPWVCEMAAQGIEPQAVLSLWTRRIHRSSPTTIKPMERNTEADFRNRGSTLLLLWQTAAFPGTGWFAVRCMRPVAARTQEMSGRRLRE